MACREGTPRAPRSGQIQNRHCSVRATPFGGRGVRRSEDRLLKCWPERQNCITQLTREGSPAGFALLQAKLPRNSSQIARGRIRRFESYMPSQISVFADFVVSLAAVCIAIAVVSVNRSNGW